MHHTRHHLQEQAGASAAPQTIPSSCVATAATQVSSSQSTPGTAGYDFISCMSPPCCGGAVKQQSLCVNRTAHPHPGGAHQDQGPSQPPPINTVNDPYSCPHAPPPTLKHIRKVKTPRFAETFTDTGLKHNTTQATAKPQTSIENLSYQSRYCTPVTAFCALYIRVAC